MPPELQGPVLRDGRKWVEQWAVPLSNTELGPQGGSSSMTKNAGDICEDTGLYHASHAEIAQGCSEH